MDLESAQFVHKDELIDEERLEEINPEQKHTEERQTTDPNVKKTEQSTQEQPKVEEKDHKKEDELELL